MVYQDRPAERPLGPIVDFDGAREPDGRTLSGKYVTLDHIDPLKHGPALWAQMCGHDFVWDYLYEPPPNDEAEFVQTLVTSANKTGWLGYAIFVDGAPVGYAFYLNITPAMGTVEVGNINFSPALQKSPAATEAMFLMMSHAFSLGYRRYEWKCNALNMPSRRAAQRLGFSFEGVFRQHLIVKGRNRDTAWFSITDGDWNGLKPAFTTWLSDDNFDEQHQQYQSLGQLTGPCRASRDPDQ